MQVGTGMPTSVIDIIQALVIVFAVAGTAYINLPRIRQMLVNRSQKMKEEVK
jgi:simple sugar transport system permease protein